MTAARLSWQMSWMAMQHKLLSGREASQMTQDAAAVKLGVSRRTFQRWELGETVPNAMELFRWADLLGMEVTAGSVIGDANPHGAKS